VRARAVAQWRESGWLVWKVAQMKRG